MITSNQDRNDRRPNLHVSKSIYLHIKNTFFRVYVRNDHQSVHPSVTRVDQPKTVEVRIMEFSPYGIAPSLYTVSTKKL